jgi:hypothetical protein
MTLNALNRRLAKVEPVLRRGACLDEPADPTDAINWAIANARLRPRHVDAWCRVIAEPLRTRLVNTARLRRAKRLRGRLPNEFGHVVSRAADVLSYLPTETVPDSGVRTVVDAAQVAIAGPIRPSRYVPEGLDQYANVAHAWGQAVIHVLGTPDGLELRHTIWAPTVADSPIDEIFNYLHLTQIMNSRRLVANWQD